MNTEEFGPSLLAAFARVPDVRSRRGRRYRLSALLTLATAAMLCGARSMYAISQWGRLQPPAVRHALGFVAGDGAMPAATTLSMSPAIRHYFLYVHFPLGMLPAGSVPVVECNV
jgi:DDE_Tnp_1-associated